jgi:TPR repeat protein
MELELPKIYHEPLNNIDSVDQGNPSGQYHFGRCLENGIGIGRDATRAADSYLLSADQPAA